jgi:hypothetical protein
MSVSSTHQRETRPSVPRTGKPLFCSHRYAPSDRRIRCSISYGDARRDRPREDLGDVRQVVGVDRAVRSPPAQLLEGLARVLQQRAVDRVHLATRREEREHPGDAVYDQAEGPLALTRRGLGAAPFRHLPGELLVERDELARPPGDAGVEFTGDAALLAQAVRLVQPDRRVVRGDVEQQPLGRRGEVGPPTRGHDDAELRLKPEPRRREAHVVAPDRQARARGPPRRFGAERGVEHLANLGRPGVRSERTTDSGEVDGGAARRVLQSDEHEREAEHLAERVQQRADDLWRLGVRPERRERGDADQIVEAAT